MGSIYSELVFVKWKEFGPQGKHFLMRNQTPKGHSTFFLLKLCDFLKNDHGFRGFVTAV